MPSLANAAAERRVGHAAWGCVGGAFAGRTSCHQPVSATRISALFVQRLWASRGTKTHKPSLTAASLGLGMRPLHVQPPINPGPAAAGQPAVTETPNTSTHSPSRPLPGSVAKLAFLFEQQAPGPSPSPAGPAKRQRTAGGPPPLPNEWLQSPPLANGGSGAGAAEVTAPVERELFDEDSGEADPSGGGSAASASAREARLEAIRKR